MIGRFWPVLAGYLKVSPAQLFGVEADGTRRQAAIQHGLTLLGPGASSRLRPQESAMDRPFSETWAPNAMRKTGEI
jgi:hypothetical protein